MAGLHSSIPVSLLLRVDSKKAIDDCWNSKSLLFGCAANWVDYARKGNHATGDPYECVFSRIPANQLLRRYDSHGILIEANVQKAPDKEAPQYNFWRYVPTMLTPAMCFFSFAAAEPNGTFYTKGPDYIFDLGKYARYMEYDLSQSAFLLIQDANCFFDELRNQIPIAIEENRANLTQTRYYSGQIQNDPPLYADMVRYDKHQRFDVFDEMPAPPEELFWKFPEYKEQHEIRLIIPHWNFVQEYDPCFPDKYDYQKNRLRVRLPHLHEYAKHLP